ncbi:uncharacterized protein LOC124969965 [Sciurus carolinensis]|uniref:uncharacterized protein LOC124969965 n=1 Tax=Sciurus carolinensis TaxID=30640 RepID=UPI001FB33E69|nr:uncharacterized protein LOC124969965 [Sciurus carolinensis]
MTDVRFTSEVTGKAQERAEQEAGKRGKKSERASRSRRGLPGEGRDRGNGRTTATVTGLSRALVRRHDPRVHIHGSDAAGQSPGGRTLRRVHSQGARTLKEAEPLPVPLGDLPPAELQPPPRPARIFGVPSRGSHLAGHAAGTRPRRRERGAGDRAGGHSPSLSATLGGSAQNCARWGPEGRSGRQGRGPLGGHACSAVWLAAPGGYFRVVESDSTAGSAEHKKTATGTDAGPQVAFPPRDSGRGGGLAAPGGSLSAAEHERRPCSASSVTDTFSHGGFLDKGLVLDLNQEARRVPPRPTTLDENRGRTWLSSIFARAAGSQGGLGVGETPSPSVDREVKSRDRTKTRTNLKAQPSFAGTTRKMKRLAQEQRVP